MVDYSFAELMLFETCNFNCAYCGFVTSGSVADIADLTPYRDRSYIDRIIGFFDRRSTEDRKWIFHLSGGEPTLMPNFDYFCGQAFASGHKVAINTNLSVPLDAPEFRASCPPDKVAFIHASLHQEGLDNLDVYLARCRRLREAGYGLFVRIVAHPQFIDRLAELDRRFAEIDVSLSVHPLQSPNYPEAYTPEQIDKIVPFMKAHHDVIRLFGGLDAQGRTCRAGSGLFCVSLGLRGGGRVYPCVNTTAQDHLMGNLFDDDVELWDGETACLRSDDRCTCAMHFVYDNIPSLDDPEEFRQLISGYKPGVGGTWRDWFAEHGVKTKFGADTASALPSQGTSIGERETKLHRPVRSRARDADSAGRAVLLPDFASWQVAGEAVATSDLGEGTIAFMSVPAKYESLVSSPLISLEAGAHSLQFRLKLTRGGLTVGVQHADTGAWLTSENHHVSGRAQIDFQLDEPAHVRVVLAAANHHGDQVTEGAFDRQ